MEQVSQTLEASPLSGRFSNIDRAQQRVLARLHEAGMSQAGEDWLIAALDPFHDKSLEVSGYPDGSRERSICQVIKRDIDIAAPESLGLADGELWDAHVFNMPNLQAETAAGGGVGNTAVATCSHAAGNNVFSDPSDEFFPGSVGNIMIVYVKTGKQTWLKGNTFFGTDGLNPPDAAGGDGSCAALAPDIEVSGNPAAGPPVEMSSDYTTGLHRVVAQGMELVNTSAVLDMRGSVTCYSQSSRSTRATGATFQAAGASIPRTYVRISGPPPTADEALNLPGATLWHSKYGAYVVNRLESDELPYTSYQTEDFIMDGGNPDALYMSGSLVPPETMPACVVSHRLSGPGLSAARPPLPRSFDLTKDRRGIYITQQDSKASFKLTVRWIVEKSAGAPQPGLVVLQPPSPALDWLAREVYSEATRLSPPGARLDENALGTWFRTAANNVLQAVQHPVVQKGLTAAATAKHPALGALVHELTAAKATDTKAHKRSNQRRAKARAEREVAEEALVHEARELRKRAPRRRRG